MNGEGVDARQLLLVQLGLLGPNLSEDIVDALLAGLEKGVPLQRLTRHRARVLLLLLGDDFGDKTGSRERRLQQAAMGLDERIQELRDRPDRSLKNRAIFGRMEVMVSCAKKVRALESAAFWESMPQPLDDFGWYENWRRARQPEQMVTLETLQGQWRNKQLQDVTVRGNICTFSQGDGVVIEVDENGSFTVPGWVLLQEQSSEKRIVWTSRPGTRQANPGETTVWERPGTMGHDSHHRGATVYSSYGNNSHVSQHNHTAYGPSYGPTSYESLHGGMDSAYNQHSRTL